MSQILRGRSIMVKLPLHLDRFEAHPPVDDIGIVGFDLQTGEPSRQNVRGLMQVRFLQVPPPRIGYMRLLSLIESTIVVSHQDDPGDTVVFDQ